MIKHREILRLVSFGVKNLSSIQRFVGDSENRRKAIAPLCLLSESPRSRSK